MFVCDGLQHGRIRRREEKRTEKNLIVRSGISEAETTNNNRLRSTFCIEAIQTRSIARPLCDNRASCWLSYSKSKKGDVFGTQCRIASNSTVVFVLFTSLQDTVILSIIVTVRAVVKSTKKLMSSIRLYLYSFYGHCTLKFVVQTIDILTVVVHSMCVHSVAVRASTP